jgi:hypothetical protein
MYQVAVMSRHGRLDLVRGVASKPYSPITNIDQHVGIIQIILICLVQYRRHQTVARRISQKISTGRRVAASMKEGSGPSIS